MKKTFKVIVNQTEFTIEAKTPIKALKKANNEICIAGAKIEVSEFKNTLTKDMIFNLTNPILC
jgi:hypothetical protein